MCDRGHPLYTSALTTTSTASKVQIRYCTQNTGGGTTNCDTNHLCTTVGTQSICCPTVCALKAQSSIVTISCCSIHMQPKRWRRLYCAWQGATYGQCRQWRCTQRQDEQIVGAVRRLYFRSWRLMAQKCSYYYDIADRTCKPFTFTGYGGNFNNFLSQESCRTYCAQSVCSVGTPLQDGSVSACWLLFLLDPLCRATIAPAALAVQAATRARAASAVLAQRLCAHCHNRPDPVSTSSSAGSTTAKRATVRLDNAVSHSVQIITVSYRCSPTAVARATITTLPHTTTAPTSARMCPVCFYFLVNLLRDRKPTATPTCTQGEAYKTGSNTYLICGGTSVRFLH